MTLSENKVLDSDYTTNLLRGANWRDFTGENFCGFQWKKTGISVVGGVSEFTWSDKYTHYAEYCWDAKTTKYICICMQYIYTIF